MNRTKLKNYAPQARRDFIQAMTDRAAFYGLTATKIEPVVERGDVAVIAGREHPRTVAKKRRQLEDRIKRHGFEQTMEALAYTWFNRLVAIRFMELHGYLEHGYRVLSHPESKPTPELLEHAEHVELPGLKKAAVIDLKLAGNREAELFRLLLTAQCNALNTAMPFLFEKIDDETELLLPDNLLHSDSLVRKLVSEIDEEDWREVEIIGWLYQFYILEKKAQVIGKMVASEDIPAATQLFTPNWIVKYCVQNTLGRQWLATYPQSALRQQMPYYIEPADQTPEVREQLKAITPTSLNPEGLTLLDPACGSGHILVEAYDLFKTIYQERGYRAKEIPALILEKNLFGLEIDDRAAQLAAFALMMKARADDRRIFDSAAKPNILAFQDSQGINVADVAHALNSPINKTNVPSEYLIEEIEEDKAGLFSKKALAEKGHVSQGDITALLAMFEKAKTFGSLIRVPPKLAATLPNVERRLSDVLTHGDLTHVAAHIITPLCLQARLLARQYDAVVTNPPYMGARSGMNPTLKAFAREMYPHTKSDLYAMFIERGFSFSKPLTGHSALVTMQSWMFLSSYSTMRQLILKEKTLVSLVHLGARAFREISGEVVTVAAFSLQNLPLPSHRPVCFRLLDGDEDAKRDSLLRREHRHDSVVQSDFMKIPGSPIAYWVSNQVRAVFQTYPPLSEVATTRMGMTTANNDLFTRMWHEVARGDMYPGASDASEFAAGGGKWAPYNKGGSYRKWYGNNDTVLNWENDGQAIKAYGQEEGHVRSTVPNTEYYFRECITWSKISTSSIAFRLRPRGSIFDVAGACLFTDHARQTHLLGLMNSQVVAHLLRATSPTLNFEGGQISDIPVADSPELRSSVSRLVLDCVETSRADWDSHETSWDFDRHPGLDSSVHGSTVAVTYARLASRWQGMAETVAGLEQEIDRRFISAYGLEGELTPSVSLEAITLTCNPAYWFGARLGEEERGRLQRLEFVRELLSYSIGCMMGRYCLDKPGLIYAHSGGQGFEPSQYQTFRADDDGVIPLPEADWGTPDDASSRVVEFIGVAWPKECLEENLKFIGDSLGPTGNEQPRDTIRRYFAMEFYKHHLSMYKKRPIYWLFSSGKQRAFQCLVYLHRYHEGTLARMRTEYVIPLQGTIASRIEKLEGDKAKANSTSHRRRLQKEQDDLKKQQGELLAFEEKLKHAADQKISLDLDDGVKGNYGKFGDLVAESKAITGEKDDE